MQNPWWENSNLVVKNSPQRDRITLSIGLMPEVGENIERATSSVETTSAPIVSDFLEQSFMSLSEEEIREICDTPIDFRPDNVYRDEVQLWMTHISRDLYDRIEELAKKIEKPVLTVIADLISHEQ